MIGLGRTISLRIPICSTHSSLPNSKSVTINKAVTILLHDVHRGLVTSNVRSVQTLHLTKSRMLCDSIEKTCIRTMATAQNASKPELTETKEVSMFKNRALERRAEKNTWDKTNKEMKDAPPPVHVIRLLNTIGKIFIYATLAAFLYACYDDTYRKTLKEKYPLVYHAATYVVGEGTPVLLEEKEAAEKATEFKSAFLSAVEKK
eukprot:TRINITY_DN1730_c0_g3_i1.p1 TRINITY_DN1730_c0_g3~~TRINITY_DN1730_c0_g3_i1.p1  ORF type:complete len:204 (+),score=8.64 TRINITY_DN1730_c0_g3_i1:74-685(+)